MCGMPQSLPFHPPFVFDLTLGEKNHCKRSIKNTILSFWWIFLMFISSTACNKVWCFSRELPSRKTWQAGFRIWAAQIICALLDILLHNRIWTWGTLWSEAWIWRHGVRCWWTDVYNRPWGTSSKCSWSCDFVYCINTPYIYLIWSVSLYGAMTIFGLSSIQHIFKGC